MIADIVAFKSQLFELCEVVGDGDRDKTFVSDVVAVEVEGVQGGERFGLRDRACAIGGELAFPECELVKLSKVLAMCDCDRAFVPDGVPAELEGLELWERCGCECGSGELRTEN